MWDTLPDTGNDVVVLGGPGTFAPSRVRAGPVQLEAAVPELLGRGISTKFKVRKVFDASGPMMLDRITNHSNVWAMVWMPGVFVPAKEAGISNAASRIAALYSSVLMAFGGYSHR